jgi:tRNA(fMet)-specific endonuclease VapC
MGLILDSSVLIAADRTGQNARHALQDISEQLGRTDIGLSVVTLIELAHGAERANTLERKEKRLAFIQDLLGGVPIYPMTVAAALRAGRIDGLSSASGVRVALADLMIGATALELGFGVATANVRHFRLIPGLSVVQF